MSKLNNTNTNKVVETILVNGVEASFNLDLTTEPVKAKVEKVQKALIELKLNSTQVGVVLMVVDKLIATRGYNMSTEGDYTSLSNCTPDQLYNKVSKLRKMKKVIEFQKVNGIEFSLETIGKDSVEVYEFSSNPGFSVISFGDSIVVVSDHFTRGEEESNIIYFGKAFINGVLDQDLVDSVDKYLKKLNKGYIKGNTAWK